jgi:hypothetical protein
MHGGFQCSAPLTLSAAAFAQQGGTAQEAKAMLDKAIAAVKADPVLAVGMFVRTISSNTAPSTIIKARALIKAVMI